MGGSEESNFRMNMMSSPNIKVNYGSHIFVHFFNELMRSSTHYE